MYLFRYKDPVIETFACNDQRWSPSPLTCRSNLTARAMLLPWHEVDTRNSHSHVPILDLASWLRAFRVNNVLVANMGENGL